ncbi:MAG TPA: ATP-binding protein [Geobacteraceae bacterium]
MRSPLRKVTESRGGYFGRKRDNPLAKIAATEGRTERDVLEQLAYNEKMAELGQMAAGLVHELNTPLSVINSAAQLILREESLSQFVREMVERISSETQRLSQFSRGLLTFSRRDEGAVGEVNLAQMVKDVMNFLRYEAQKRSILVVEDLDYRLPAVAADGNHLKQIFINLIMNALQAMEANGTLLVRTSMLDGDTVEVEIADTGAGIPAEAAERIFEPFFTTKKPGEGTGLGLFITKKIVELYGGTIKVRSLPGQGTTFFVRLPAVAE